MKRCAFVALAVTLGGCGMSLPELTRHETLPLDALIEKIDCEFQEVVWHQVHDLGRTFLSAWQGQYTITLKSNEIGSAKATTNTFPFLPAKNLTLNATVGGGETTTANRTALMKFNLDFATVKRKPVCDAPLTNSIHPFIKGRIGFEEWMDKAFRDATVGGRHQIGKPQPISSLGHTFEFSIDVNGNAGMGFVIGAAPSIGINPAGTIDRLDDGIVDVVIAKPAVDPLAAIVTGLTKDESKVIDQLEKLIAALQKEIDGRKIALEKSSVGSKLSTMSSKTIQDLLPDDDVRLRAFGLNREQAIQLKNDNELMVKNQTDEKQILEFRKQIAAIGQPKITTRSHVLPPDRNPEIANVSQQLAIERLNNNLRVPIP